MRKLTEYLVTLKADEEDALRRSALLLSAMARVLRIGKLVRVETSDLRAGELTLRVLAEEASPELVPGEVLIRVEAVGVRDNVRQLTEAAG